MTSFDRARMMARLATSSKDEVVLEEMIRRGFWREGVGEPSLPAELIRKQAEIRRELEGLAKDASAYEDRDRALKRLQIERMKAAREKRRETKLKNAQARHDRALAWQQRQAKEITHLGDDVSAALHGAKGDTTRLSALKLPALGDAPALAAAMGIPLGELRFLAYDRKVAKVDHYARFTIPKKTGGVREISAPMPRLKRTQYWVLDNILTKMPGHAASHGFRPKHSIITNANPHVGKRVVINIDLKDFFPTISYARVKGLFVSLGYPEKVAAPLALLCTDAERDKVEVDGKVWSVAREGRRLPQGAPTSPAIANIIANRLDKRMSGAAKKLGFTYTRYADDMTFSGDAVPGTAAVNRMIWQARQIAEAEGFKFNDTKTRVMGAGTRQDVTGLVVNVRPAVPREERRRFRAWLHAAETAVKTRTALPAWTNAKGAASDPMGFASYLAMVDKTRGADIVARTKVVVFGHGSKAAKAAKKAGAVSHDDFRKGSAAGTAPRDKWWTPAVPVPPVQEPIETPKRPARTLSSAAQGTSVPPVANATARASRTLSPRGAEPQAQTPPSASGATRPVSLLTALLQSLAALALVLVPGVGALLALLALVVVWARYIRSRSP